MGIEARSRGWGFKIDYDRAIAEDDREIQWAQRSLERGWFQRQIPYSHLNPTSTIPGSYVVDSLWLLILYCRDVATSCGYSAQDVADLAEVAEIDVWKMHPDLPEAQPNPVGHRRGKAILAEIDELSFASTAGRSGDGLPLHADASAAKDRLRRARASRARHVRNKDKHAPQGAR